MAPTETTTISVKVPIKWNAMTDAEQKRLERITGRDTRVITAFLGIIARHEKELIIGKRKKSINGSKLEKLTLTAERFKEPSKRRLSVPHDFKKRFPNISVNELQECRRVAVAMWNSYLELDGMPPLHSRSYRARKLPRYIHTRRFKLHYRPNQETKYWLDLIDSLDSAKTDSWTHDRLIIPLNPSSYHLNRLDGGQATSLRLFKDSSRKWWAVFAVRVEVSAVDMTGLPSAVMGIDLGIDKAVCSAVLTEERVRYVRYFTQPEKIKQIKRYDEMVDSLQQEMNRRKNTGRDYEGVAERLKELSGRRLNISIDHDGVLVRNLTNHILELSTKYNLYVAIGRLTHIRRSARRSSGKSKSFRKKIARWTFARVSENLKRSLAQEGWNVDGEDSHFIPVSESWTSITCHKCGHKGVRPKQSLFICPTCGYRCNADKNGAINIARRVIKLIPSLGDETGLERWLLPHEREQSSLKARRSSASNEKSLPLSEISASGGRSAAECYDQTSIMEFVSATDPAVVRTVEQPSAATDAHKAADSRGNLAQRSEAPSGSDPDKARVQASGGVPESAGDSRHEKGGTRELKVSGEVHSPSTQT
ncbi:MAG: transposase [Candidatus Thorarchaeota archaeon]